MKSMKKLVLAGLVLLASMVVLAGCDTPLEPESTTVNEQSGGSENDSVPEVPKYTVKFETEHETAPTSITVESGTKLTAEQLKVLPDTDDNIFEGWYDGETQAKGDEYTVTKDVTLVARWRNRDTVASVTFDPSSTKLYYGKTVTVTLSTTTEGARIHYQLGEGEWKIYEKPFTVSSETVVTAYATKDGLKDSEKTKSNYLRQLISITVTPPTRTVYSVGEPFDGSGMVVTATYDDGKERTVEGTITSETSSLTQTAGIDKEVTVSYTEGEITKQDSFTVVVFPEGVKILTDYTSPNHTDNTWTYVAFGEWPQSEAKDFSPKTEATSYGIFKGNYYAEEDGKYVKVGDKYYLVESIVWRVLNKNYSSTGQALLLAENILTGGIKWADSINNYMASNIRKWLNGNSGSEKESDYSGDAGFLQTAFTSEAQGLITPTSVDNSARSTNPESNATQWNSGKNEYACENTTDKIFLLSEQEATKSDYVFAVYNAYGQDNTRIRVTTDYAKATGAYQSGGGWWWLRSPLYSRENNARLIDVDGNVIYISVYNLEVGVVPALSISL